MFQYIFLGFVGLCSGVIIAGGITGLLMGLSIVPRYAGITRTADHILLYEDLALLGTVTGNLFYLFQWKLPLGSPFLMLYGIFSWADGSWPWQKWQMFFQSSPEGSVSKKGSPL